VAGERGFLQLQGMSTRNYVLTAAVLGLLAGAGWGAGLVSGSEASAADTPSLTPAADAATGFDAALALFQERARTDPYSAGDRASLAGLYLQRARETGDHEDVLRAEKEARESIRLRTAHNRKAYEVLALSLLEQHRFGEALEAARELASAEPENASYRALLGEVQLELGDYRAAAVTFGSLESARKSLDVAPRLARWAEISGRTAEARALLYAARERALAHTGLAPEQRAWFHLRVGDLELRSGRLDAAEEAFRAGLATFPDDYRLHVAMARLEAARGRWDEAVAHAEEALAVAPEPGTFALLSEIHTASGDPGAAAEYARGMEVSLSGANGAFHRAEGLFLLDRGLRVREVLATAQRELESRRDVYGHDLLAWALHRTGRHAEARAAMRSALAQGTRDALLLYHAGMIERSLGNREGARAYLEEALAVNPRFHPLHAPAAREALSCLRRIRLPWQSTCR
jgi:tetratricopeptide (TPR) repeat protein